MTRPQPSTILKKNLKSAYVCLKLDAAVKAFFNWF